ncbi:flagellar hook-basal body complex protein FliE [Alteromonas sp. ASW11-130]|uniref:flagellar hook-basal body complex protein FliE n=1 Tax=Alteromonas sp. ASW11-130 TaxID=3015775 RepID=UPI0022428B39|nr:flagellar hook-basal body complex protein FliE [Alteromonas sp. ASW11-130]MCW8090357.1 flagellar hook-basal body complex protein FliE [Alteromonas sp. ASW11-130]
MDIKANSLYQEMQAMISQAQLPVHEAPNIVKQPESEFGAMLKNALEGVNDAQMQSRNMQKRFEMGDPSLSLAEVMIAKEKSSIAFEATLQVRNKLLDAYKTISNMPV